MSMTKTLLTAEEYRLLPDNGQPTELVRGRPITMNMPAPRHGYICGNIVRLVGNSAQEQDGGRVMSNDSGVVTQRDPDTVRGADVSFYSYANLPKGPLPEGYLDVVPEVVFEVLSPGDSWKEIVAKVGEYLQAGVKVVCVLDPIPQTVHIYYADRPSRILSADDELALPELLGSFRVVVRQFFE